MKKTVENIHYQEQAYYASAFNCISEGVFIFDAALNILNTNPALFKLFRLDSREQLTNYWNDLDQSFNFYDFHGMRLTPQQLPFHQILRQEEVKNLKLKIVNVANEHEIYINCNGHAVLDEQGSFKFGLLTMQNITEYIKLKDELNNRLEESQQYQQVLTDSENQLRGERELLQTLINSIPVMITIYDPEMKEILLNKAVEDISGWTIADTGKKSIMELAYPDHAYRKKISKYMQSLESGFKDIVMRTKDGRDIQTSWANIRLMDGRQVGIGIDVSKRIETEKALVKAKERAENAARLQSAFIQNVSHEVRTPMNSILGFTELLQKSIQGGIEKKYLDAISFNGNQLLRLINDIVDLSRMDNEELDLVQSKVSLQQIIRDTGQQFEGLKLAMNKSQIEFVENIPAFYEDIALNADVDRLQQVITNLLSNAVKYTDEGYIEIGYEVHEDHGEVVVHVKDTGEGIPFEDQQRVFTRFEQFNDDRTREYGGTGLGLPICEQLVALWGGTIWFDSEPGKGTTFFFSHPYSGDHMEIAIEDDSETKDKAPNLSGKTILIAEDDQYSFMMMQSMLMDTHAEVLHAEDGEKAVKLFTDQEVDFVFMDIRLPRLDGYQVLEIISKLKPEIPVVALTANALNQEKKKSEEAGFDCHVTKPIAMKELFGLLYKYLR